ncbi:MAG: hypothetical protein C0183_14615 [Roseiflexus castenholzii]|uniref:hypothetical protein n=1 Tax=Roseiflexus castenholzii TaxID=120962 RepID=UPI000CC7CDFF|nr:MAG: hypothetical protein C0183_14615 [Roseiflexus castenholzii]
MTSLQQATTKVTNGHEGNALHVDSPFPLRALRVLGGEAFYDFTATSNHEGHQGIHKKCAFMLLPLRALRVLGGEAGVQATSAL